MDSKPTPAERRRDQNEPGTVTGEVGSEGGSPGDVELSDRTEPATGSEAGETYQRPDKPRKEIRRDETGIGRRA